MFVPPQRESCAVAKWRPCDAQCGGCAQRTPSSHMLHVAALILGCPTVGPPPTRGLSPVVAWVYGDDGTTMPTDSVQKATWEAFGEACVKGRSQSPINICTKSTQRLAKGSPSLQIHLQDEEMLPMNSGHNFELTIVDGQEKLYADVEGDKLQFMQVHWHAPAENTVDGSYAAMEAHFVHQGPSDELAVVALRYRITEQCNPHLARFWDSFPIVEGTAESDVPAVPLGMLLSPKLLAGGYYRWDGSLTTPPCTEGVRWFLLKEEATVCEVSSHPPHPHPTPHPPTHNPETHHHYHHRSHHRISALLQVASSPQPQPPRLCLCRPRSKASARRCARCRG